MLKPIVIVAALVPAALVGGCEGTVNRGLESIHQPVVARSTYLLDVVATPRGLAPGERQRLAGWFAGLRLGFGDVVAVDDPAPALDAARADVARAAALHGLLLSPDVPVTGAPVVPGTIRVVVSRARAGVPGCPDWSRMNSPDYENNTSSNYGCSVNSSLAAMVADPNDLVRGRDGNGVTDNATSGRAISTFRKATPGSGSSSAGSTTGSIGGGK